MPWTSGDALTSTNLNTKISSDLGFNVRDYGAVGNGIVDDTVAVQAAMTAAGAAGIVFVPPGRTYIITATLTFAEGLTLNCGGAARAGKGTLTWNGAIGGTMFAPVNTAASNEGFFLHNLELNGGQIAAIGIDLHHVSHAVIHDCYIHHFNNRLYPGNGTLCCGIRLYRDQGAGYSTYYNRIVGGQIDDCNNAVLVTGTGAGSQSNCANTNWLVNVTMKLNDNTNVYFERGNDLQIIGCSSEWPTAGGIHFRTNGVGMHIVNCRIENSAPANATGIQLDASASQTMEVGGYWSGFNSLTQVVDNSTAKDFQQLSTQILGNTLYGPLMVSGGNTTLDTATGGPQRAYQTSLSGVLKGLIGTSATTNALVSGSTVGDLNIRTNGGDLWVSVNSGSSAQMHLSTQTLALQVNPSWGALGAFDSTATATTGGILWYNATAAKWQPNPVATLNSGGLLITGPSSAVSGTQSNVDFYLTNSGAGGGNFRFLVGKTGDTFPGGIALADVRTGATRWSVSSQGFLGLYQPVSVTSATTLPSAVSGTGYFYADSLSSLYWVNGSGVSKLVA